MSLYGPIIGADDVADRVKDHLVQWAPAYIAEVARQAALPAATLPPFGLFEIRADDVLEAWASLPACHVRCHDTKPVQQRGGRIAAQFPVSIRVAAGGTDESTTARLVARYAKAVRAALLQHPSLDGFAEAVRLTGESYTNPRSAKDLWAGEATVNITVTVAAIVDMDGGPVVPPADPLLPPAADPETTSVDAWVDRDRPPAP